MTKWDEGKATLLVYISEEWGELGEWREQRTPLRVYRSSDAASRTVAEYTSTLARHQNALTDIANECREKCGLGKRRLCGAHARGVEAGKKAAASQLRTLGALLSNVEKLPEELSWDVQDIDFVESWHAN